MIKVHIYIAVLSRIQYLCSAQFMNALTQQSLSVTGVFIEHGTTYYYLTICFKHIETFNGKIMYVLLLFAEHS